MRGDEERDELITAALRSYAEPGEIPESRVVLTRVMERAEQKGSRGGRVWVWLIPVTACAMAVFVIGLVWMLRTPRDPQIAWTPRAPDVVSGEVVSSGDTSTPRHARHAEGLRVAAAQPERLPKLDVFPTPTPLLPEEQALAGLARPAQAAVTQQILAAQKHIDDPIDFADLRIRPLDIEGNQVPPTGKEKR